MPPVNEDALIALFGSTVRVVRNDRSIGIGQVRKLGVNHATGDLVAQLDDDDRFAEHALQQAVNTFQGTPDIDVVFLNVKGFGPKSDHFAQAQSSSLNQVLETAQAERDQSGLTVFQNQKLFEALLNSVPSAFQHPVARRGTWETIYRLMDLARESDLDDPELENLRADQLNECEWALYAAGTTNVVLLNDYLYLARCGHDRFYSVTRAKNSQALASYRMKRGLMKLASSRDQFASLKPAIQFAYGKALFNLGYQKFRVGQICESRSRVKQAMSVDFRVRYLRFLLRTYLPLRRDEDSDS